MRSKKKDTSNEDEPKEERKEQDRKEEKGTEVKLIYTCEMLCHSMQPVPPHHSTQYKSYFGRHRRVDSPRILLHPPTSSPSSSLSPLTLTWLVSSMKMRMISRACTC